MPVAGGMLWYTGTGLGEVQDERISATFSGLIEYDRSGAYAACTAIDDRFDFVQ